MARFRRIDRRIAAMVLAATLGLAGCDSVEDRAERHYERGTALLERGEPEKARIEFRNALRLNENHVGSRFRIGQFFEGDGEMRAAVSNYNLVAELDANHLEARHRLAEIYLTGGAIEDAERMIAEALRIAPQDAEVIAINAAARLAAGAPDDAIAVAEEALQIDPSNVGANVVRVAALSAQGRPSAALELVTALLEDYPGEAAFNLQRLRLLGELNDSAGVEEQLTVMVERFPEETQLRRALVQLSLQRSDFDAAEGHLRAIIDQTDSIDSRIDLVRLIQSTEGADAARALLDTMIADAATTEQAIELRFAKVAYETGLGDRDEARSILSAIAAEHAGSDHGDRAVLQLARLDLEGGDQDAAMAHVERVLSRDADNVDGLAVRASIRLEQLDPARAIEDLRRALNLDPQNTRLLMLEARAQEMAGNPSLVTERLGSALRFSNHAPEIALTFARHLRGRNQASAAETVLTEAARRHPNSREVLAALAELRLAAGNVEGAERVAAQLRDLEGGAVFADQIVASALAQAGELDASIGVLERMAADEATADTALGGLITAYVRAGQVDRARTMLDDIIETNPENVRAQVLRAELSLFERDPADAEARLQALLDIAPEATATHLAYARFLAQAGRREEAETVLRTGIETVAASEPLRLNLAQLLEVRGAFDEAIAEYRILFERSPDSLIVANNLASLIAEHQYEDTAAMAFARRVAMRLRASTVPHFQDTYGWIQFLAGEHEVALRSLVPAAEQLPNNPIVRYHLGRAFAALGRNEQARENLEAALAIDPGFPKADSARDTLAAMPQSGG